MSGSSPQRIQTKSLSGLIGRVERGSRTQSLSKPERDLRTVQNDFFTALSSISMHFDLNFRNGLIRQVRSLLDEENWDPDDELPQAGAITTFLRVLLISKASSRPGLGSNGKGSITAAWTVGSNRLTLECYKDDRVVFLLSRKRNDGMVDRAAGETQVGRLMAALSTYEPNVWFHQ